MQNKNNSTYFLYYSVKGIAVLFSEYFFAQSYMFIKFDSKSVKKTLRFVEKHDKLLILRKLNKDRFMVYIK